jgi:hypothetical protein
LNNYCKICKSSASNTFKALVLQKYEVKYFKCGKCGFIQTEKPFWLDEAYQSAITSLDIGLLYRNLQFSEMLETFLLKNIVDSNGKFIDYGGGYGIFVRLMRDRGFNFFRQDLYCENLFAKHFDISDINTDRKFELLTAFEVFEHLEDPLTEVSKMLSLSDSIFFSTELLPSNNPTPDTWWYFAPETGQHISFYTLESLQIIAEKLNFNLYSNRYNLHMLSKEKLAFDPFEIHRPPGRLQRLLSLFKDKHAIKRKESLLMKDFNYVKTLINNNRKA